MPLLFAYGTLAPADHGAASREGWEADGVRGQLYDLGPYPALVDIDDPAAAWVEGFVRAVSWDVLSNQLDAYEGVDEGLFRRVQATARSGRRVWVYVYARSLPPTARGPLIRWDGTTRFRFSTSLHTDSGGP
jgi:gamma-glutamylcyclotransferase (GGCT)/AIG2-like uncharacterized protein YtfP